MRVTFKFFTLVMLLLFGVLMGMNIAEKGIYQVMGVETSPESFQIVEAEDKVEVKVLGETYIPEKPKKVNEDTIEVNFVSNLGNKIGELFQKGTEKGLIYIAKLIE